MQNQSRSSLTDWLDSPQFRAWARPCGQNKNHMRGNQMGLSSQCCHLQQPINIKIMTCLLLKVGTLKAVLMSQYYYTVLVSRHDATLFPSCSCQVTECLTALLICFSLLMCLTLDSCQRQSLCYTASLHNTKYSSLFSPFLVEQVMQPQPRVALNGQPSWQLFALLLSCVGHVTMG